MLLYRNSVVQSVQGPNNARAEEHFRRSEQAPPLVILSAGLTPAQGNYLVIPDKNSPEAAYAGSGLVFLNGTDKGGKTFYGKDGKALPSENSELAVYGSSGLAVFGDNTKASARLSMDETGRPRLSLTDKDGKKARILKP